MLPLVRFAFGPLLGVFQVGSTVADGTVSETRGAFPAESPLSPPASPDQ